MHLGKTGQEAAVQQGDRVEWGGVGLLQVLLLGDKSRARQKVKLSTETRVERCLLELAGIQKISSLIKEAILKKKLLPFGHCPKGGGVEPITKVLG